jgi:ABC-type phosphate transport system substrate-binding protein
VLVKSHKEGMKPVRQRRVLKLGLVGMVATGLTLVGGARAWADYAPQPGDVVGVGGDTPQYALSFLADGDYNGDAGFNASGAYNRLVTFNATADANGRSAYTNSVTTGAASVALNPTDVLRAGTFPVQRVQSSGAAITALLADTASPEVINFVFSASLPSSAQQSQASTQGWGYLHVVEIGTDSVDIAVDNTTNAPAGLSAAELLKIYTGVYTTWNQIPGNSSGSTDTIVPEIPPSGSSIYKTFIADLTTANGGVAPTLSASVKTVEQNDPTAITSDATPADAIVPFSAARLALWNDGYFHNPATVFPGSSSPLTAGVKLLSATAPDGSAAYASPITDYVIFRQSDASSTTPFEPGGSRNWVQTLFSNPGGSTPLVAKSAGQALIAASGVTPNYDDLGDVHS